MHFIQSPTVILAVTVLFVACGNHEVSEHVPKSRTKQKNSGYVSNETKAEKPDAAAQILKQKKSDFLSNKTKAEKGDAVAQTLMADNYALGRGVEVNFQEALKWYRKAAAQDEPRAQFNLGYMYYNGEALPRDY